MCLDLCAVGEDEHYYLLQDLGDTMLKTIIDRESLELPVPGEYAALV